MKIGTGILIIVILGSLISGCNKKEVISVSDSVYVILNQDNVCKTNINKLGDYSLCHITEIDEADIVISQAEIDEYCDMQLESFAQIIPVEDRKVVKEGDVVYVSYLVFQDDKLINRIEGDNLIVGAGNYDEQIEEALIGQCVGEPFSVEVTAQASEKRLFNITVDSINYFKTYELTEEFVKEKWGFDTVDEYYQSCKNVLIEEKKSQQKRKAERELLLSIARLCDFTIDKEEVAKYSMRYVQEGEALAYVYEMDLNLYIKEVLGKSVKEFYQDCYETGENEIKQYLVVGAIFADKNLTITQEEYNQMCKKMGYDPDEVKKNEYEDAVIKYSIMKEEVLQLYQ